jgi:ABC-type sugar transport system substrate-binding protein
LPRCGTWRRSLAVGLLAVAVLAILASSAGATNDQAGVVIGYSNPAGTEEGLRGVGWGEKQAIKALKLPWTVREIDARVSADKQVSDIDAMISLKVGGITSWTVDQGAAEAAYKRARDAGIAVIGINSQSKFFNTAIAAWTDTTCLVSDEQAAFIDRLIPNAKILALGGPPVPSITLTTNCFLRAAKKRGLQVLEFQKANFGQPDEGQKMTQSMLLKHPDTQAIWTFTEGLALGAGAALRSNGKTIWSGSKKGIVLVSRNGTSAAAQAIRTGNLTVTWDNNQPLVGAAAVQILKYLLVDKVKPASLPTEVPIKSKRWDLSNISSYASPVTRAVPLPMPAKFSGLKAWCARQSPTCKWRSSR